MNENKTNPHFSEYHSIKSSTKASGPQVPTPSIDMMTLLEAKNPKIKKF